MPWRCPACQEPIRHSELESKPREGQRYRCHICRLELLLNPATGRLEVTPFEPPPDRAPRRSRSDH